MNWTPGRWIAVPAVAALLAGAGLAGTASARPSPPPPKCLVRVLTAPRMTMTDFTSEFGVSPTRVIGLTFGCDGGKLPRRLRAYVNRGDWNRYLPAGTTLYPGKRVILPGR